MNATPRPPAWGLLPGLPGIVGLVGPPHRTRALRSRLPRDWTVVPVGEPSLIHLALRDASVICFAPEELESPGSRTCLSRLESIVAELRIPVVTFVSPSRPAFVAGLKDSRSARVVVESAEHQPLSRTVMDVAVRPLLEHVAREIEAGLGGRSSLLALCLARVVRQVPPPAPVAADGGPDLPGRFRRRVTDLTDWMGCSRSYLYSLAGHTGLDLGEFMRRNVVLHGLLHYEPARPGPGGRCPLEVRRGAAPLASRLGFSSAAALRAALARSTGMGLRELARMPLGFHADRLLEVVHV